MVHSLYNSIPTLLREGTVRSTKSHPVRLIRRCHTSIYAGVLWPTERHESLLNWVYSTLVFFVVLPIVRTPFNNFQSFSLDVTGRNIAHVLEGQTSSISDLIRWAVLFGASGTENGKRCTSEKIILIVRFQGWGGVWGRLGNVSSRWEMPLVSARAGTGAGA